MQRLVPRARVLLALPLIAHLGCSRLPDAPARVLRGAERGIVFVDWTASGYATLEAAASLEALAATRATTVVMVVTAYQSGPKVSAVRLDDPRTPGRAAVIQALDRAKALGLRTALKPHVDLDDGSWRGHISPSDPAAWFAS